MIKRTGSASDVGSSGSWLDVRGHGLHPQETTLPEVLKSTVAPTRWWANGTGSLSGNNAKARPVLWPALQAQRYAGAYGKSA
jgi:hypothetical protein